MSSHLSRTWTQWLLAAFILVQAAHVSADGPTGLQTAPGEAGVVQDGCEADPECTAKSKAVSTDSEQSDSKVAGNPSGTEEASSEESESEESESEESESDEFEDDESWEESDEGEAPAKDE